VVLHHPVLLGSATDVEEVVRAVFKVWNHRRAFKAGME
jgi:hypothetical protein